MDVNYTNSNAVPPRAVTHMAAAEFEKRTQRIAASSTGENRYGMIELLVLMEAIPPF